MGKKINVYFNICVLPHNTQFERVPSSFDGFPYLNSFHTSALGVLWGLQSEGANSPSQAKHVVSKSCAKQMLLTTLMSRLPSAGREKAVQVVAGSVQQFLCLADE